MNSNSQTALSIEPHELIKFRDGRISKLITEKLISDLNYKFHVVKYMYPTYKLRMRVIHALTWRYRAVVVAIARGPAERRRVGDDACVRRVDRRGCLNNHDRVARSAPATTQQTRSKYDVQLRCIARSAPAITQYRRSIQHTTYEKTWDMSKTRSICI